MDYTCCSICKDISDSYYYPHDHDEIYSPFFAKMETIGISPNDKPFHAHFLKCPSCGTYYSYQNWQQGIGNIGEFDQIDRFTEAENKHIKPILEEKSATKLKKAVVSGIEYENGKLAEKAQLAFECAIKILPFPVTFPVIKFFISYKKTWSTIYGKPAMQGRYWACYWLRYLIKTGKAIPGEDINEAIDNCFKQKIEYKEGNKPIDRWQAPSDLPIVDPY